MAAACALQWRYLASMPAAPDRSENPRGSLENPRLRLVRADQGSALALAARRDIEVENRRSAALALDAHEDVRRILALRAAEVLEGGRAAVLRPDARRRLVRLGTMLGLRRFEANLVLAVVQEGARRGESPAGPRTVANLSAIPAPLEGAQHLARRRAIERAVIIAGAIAIAATAVVMLVNWLVAAR